VGTVRPDPDAAVAWAGRAGEERQAPILVGDGSGSRAHAIMLGDPGECPALGGRQACPGPVVAGAHLATVLQVPVEILERAGADRRHFLTDVVGVSIAQLVASDLIEHGFAAALHGGYPTADHWARRSTPTVTTT
jgi:hypothetical protein